MKKIKIATIFGTRPEAIKMAPVVLELKKYEQYIQSYVVVTAQHRQMLDQVLHLFDIKPDFDLNIMTQRQTLYDVTSKALLGLGEVFTQIKPDLVLVHGDTTTTFMGALAAYYQQISIGHVEAGLRTGDKYSPFPEEMNRHLTGALTDYHFAPTNVSRDNLLRENISKDKIFVTGNTVIDSLKQTVDKDYEFSNPVIEKCLKSGRKIILVTTHRRENWGEPLRNIYIAMRELVNLRDDIEIIFPVHKNPIVSELVAQELSGQDRINLIEPLDYQPFANLMARSYLILSDSGGVQEEAPSLGVPVLVLRNTTERPEAVEAGTVKLVGTDKDKVFATVMELLKNPEVYQKLSKAKNPYGDGLAAQRIVQTILHEKGFLPRKIDLF